VSLIRSDLTRSARVRLKLKETTQEWVQKRANPAAVDGSTVGLLAASGRTNSISAKTVTNQSRRRCVTPSWRASDSVSFDHCGCNLMGVVLLVHNCYLKFGGEDGWGQCSHCTLTVGRLYYPTAPEIRRHLERCETAFCS
jgi:hypothetical protein